MVGIYSRLRSQPRRGVTGSIGAHLTYMESDTGLRRWPLSDRGATTIEHANLDRGGFEGLRRSRTNVFMGTLRIIREIKNNPQSTSADAVLRELVPK